MKVLFIGGTGRLSKDVAFKALTEGHQVFLLTRGSENRKLFVHSGYNMIYGDIRKPEECKRLLHDFSFDTVIDFLSYNVDELNNTLSIVNGKFKQFIFISTATIYQKENDFEIIQEEKTRRGNMKWDYAYNKYLCEEYLSKKFANNISQYFTIIRPYVTYGNNRVPYPIVPIQNDMEWSLIYRIKNKCPIPVFDHGEIITTLTHTKDFAKFSVGLIGNEQAVNESFHITSDERTTWENVLNIIDNRLQIKSIRFDVSQNEITNAMPYYKSILEGDKGTTMIFDNTKIKSVVEKERFTVSLSEGLNDTLTFYHEHPELQKIDYFWLGEIDKLCDIKGIRVHHIQFPSREAKEQYHIGRYGFASKIQYNIRRMKNKLRVK